MKPVHVALIVSTVYLIPSLLYIFLSTHFAADLATSPEQAATFELIKGAIYVTLAASIVFVSCWKAVTVFREKQHRLELMSQALLDAEHRATTNLLTASVAHDVRNELAILKSNNDFLRHHAGLEEITSDAVADQESAIERLIELSNQLVDAGNPDGDATPEKVDIVHTIREVVQSLREHNRLKDCSVIFDVGHEPLEMSAYKTMIYHTTINLLFNAADAVDSGGRIEVRLLQRNDASVAIEVHDDGPGIPSENIEYLFDPFFTTKSSGTGLGLISVKACALAHGGEVEIETSDLGGACVRVLLNTANPELDAGDLYWRQTEQFSLQPQV